MCMCMCVGMRESDQKKGVKGGGVINVQDSYFHLANNQPFNFPLSHTFITVTDFLP